MEDLPKTYASALLDLAQRSDILDQVHSDIDTLQAIPFNKGHSDQKGESFFPMPRNNISPQHNRLQIHMNDRDVRLLYS